MKFPYEALVDPQTGEEILRPYVKVLVRGPRMEAELFMLVDTGADQTTIPAVFAELLELTPTGAEVELEGLTGGRETSRLYAAEFQLGPFVFTSRAAASKNDRILVLGHVDFFDQFWVAFDNSKHLLEVRPHFRVARSPENGAS